MSESKACENRTAGRAMILASAPCRPKLEEILRAAGFQPCDVDDPYAATAEICHRPLAYRAVVLSLNSLYQEELSLISLLKRRFRHIEIYLANTDGMPAALAQAFRLGADGLIGEDGIHRLRASQVQPGPGQGAWPGALSPSVVAMPDPVPAQPPPQAPRAGDEPGIEQAPKDRTFLESPTGEPVLTAEELRALLTDAAAKPAAHPEG